MVKNVYVIENPENGRVKIGITDNIKKRLSALISACGSKLVLRYLSPLIKEAGRLEKDLHGYFQPNRCYGEWFLINPNEAIERIKSTMHNYGVLSEGYEKKSFVKEPTIHQRDYLPSKHQEFEDFDEHVLMEPLSRFKRQKDGTFIRKSTKEKFAIRYENKQWLIKRLPF